VTASARTWRLWPKSAHAFACRWRLIKSPRMHANLMEAGITAGRHGVARLIQLGPLRRITRHLAIRIRLGPPEHDTRSPIEGMPPNVWQCDLLPVAATGSRTGSHNSEGSRHFARMKRKGCRNDRAVNRKDSENSKRTSARSLDRNPTRKLHRGQPPYAPYETAGHMATHDQAARTLFNPFVGGGRPNMNLVDRSI
jgi:hypothetical protein